ncbi:nucleoside-diphosphate sugar epimerase/dehydratase [Sphingopyxis sp.]|jgi:FlaA1/EpsC-like NDP-sugar epimerase|uniref:nucleoside-diphosphate sugar epimerase/dehydratase n=1 Tax=Sphingopyxis sp. TaxID=1908224 RepID=UPI002DFB0551|nr:nucleoside-diphosphate sugar epimerase/dehydratase [Sphingopyxis sp.]
MSGSNLRSIESRIVSIFGDVITLLANGERHHRRIMAVLIDAVLCVFSVWLALSLRVGYWDLGSRTALLLIAVALPSWFVVAWLSGIYLSIIRSAGSRTMFGLVWACFLMALPMSFSFLFIGASGVPRTMGVLQPIIFLMLLVGSRLAIRYVLVDLMSGGRGAVASSRVLIYGAGRAGQQLAQALRHENHVVVAGFIDDDPLLVGALIDRLPIYLPEAIDRLVDDLAVDEVLLALPSVSRARRREIFESLRNAAVHVRSLPSIGNIIDGKVSVSDLREIQIEELLGREPVPPDEALLEAALVGRTVLVTGAGGSIGSELCRQIIRRGPGRLVLVEQSEFALYAIADELRTTMARDGIAVELVEQLVDVGQKGAIERQFARWSPEIVFHAAAYKHVPLVEANPVAGLWNNVFGTLHCCLAAEAAGVDRFILVSTDKAVRPTNVMGASKRICELVLQARADRKTSTIFSMVRFGNVLGSSGSVVPKFREQISWGGPVTITHRDVTRYFMTIPEASQLVIQAGAMATGGEVFVLDMGQPVRIHDLAVTMVHLSGLTVRSAENPDGDIEIREIGLRPGEKLYEELLIGESPEKTAHDRIMRAREAKLPWSKLGRELDTLKGLLEAGDAEGAKRLMAKLVPEYMPADADR